MTQNRCESLAVAMACPTDVVVGEPVDIVDNLEVGHLSSIASVNQVGYVEKHEALATTCTIVTWLKRRLWGARLAAGEMPVGPFVLDAANKAVGYTQDEFVGVTGDNTGPFGITEATAGYVVGTEAGPVAIASAINNRLAIKVGGGESQLIPLTTGAALTMQEIADDINTSAVGFTATVSLPGNLVLTANDVADGLEVEATDGDCYTDLGLTAAVYAPIAAAGGTHTGTVDTVVTVVLDTNDKLKLKVGATGASQSVTLTPGEGVALQTIADEINAQTDNLSAGVDGDGCLSLAAYATYDDLEVEAVANDAYTLLGLTAAVYTATAAAAGTHTGTEVEPIFIASAVNTEMLLKITGGASQPVTLTAGAARTIDQILGEINGGTTGLTASKDAETGFLVITTDNVAHDLVIEEVENNAYATIGLTAGTFGHVEQHNKFKLKIGDGLSQTFTMSTGSRSITQIVADFAAATGFSAVSAAGKLRLITDDLAAALEVEAVAGDCYTALGFTVDVYDEIWSHNPAAIQGIMIAGPAPCSVTGTVREPFAIVTGTNDKIKLTVGDGESQTFTLVQATAATAQDIADTINATAVGITAASSLGRLTLTADASWQDIEIEAISHDAYDDLGLEAEVTAYPTAIETLERA